MIEILVYGALMCGAGYFWYRFLERKDTAKNEKANTELEKLRLQKEILELKKK
jgi:hypothetical protein